MRAALAQLRATKPIHVSIAALTCGLVGFALWGIGNLIRAGSLNHLHVAQALEVIGPLLLSVEGAFQSRRSKQRFH